RQVGETFADRRRHRVPAVRSGIGDHRRADSGGRPGVAGIPPGAGAPTPFLRKGVDMRDVAGFSSPFRRRAERRANARVAREGDGFIYTERSASRWYFVAV